MSDVIWAIIFEEMPELKFLGGLYSPLKEGVGWHFLFSRQFVCFENACYTLFYDPKGQAWKKMARIERMSVCRKMEFEAHHDWTAELTWNWTNSGWVLMWDSKYSEHQSRLEVGFTVISRQKHQSLKSLHGLKSFLDLSSPNILTHKNSLWFLFTDPISYSILSPQTLLLCPL